MLLSFSDIHFSKRFDILILIWLLFFLKKLAILHCLQYSSIHHISSCVKIVWFSQTFILLRWLLLGWFILRQLVLSWLISRWMLITFGHQSRKVGSALRSWFSAELYFKWTFVSLPLVLNKRFKSLNHQSIEACNLLRNKSMF